MQVHLMINLRIIAAMAGCLTLQALPAEDVHGTLTTPDGKPIAGAEVGTVWADWTFSPNPKFGVMSAHTDRLGRFVLKGAPAKPTSDHPIPLMVRVRPGVFDRAVLTIENSSAAVSGKLRSVKLQVMDGKGRPVEGASVEIGGLRDLQTDWKGRPTGVVYSGFWHPSSSDLKGTTDSKGEAVFHGIPQGVSATFHVEHGGLVDVDRMVALTGDGDASDTVTLVTAAVLKGRVLVKGKPVSDVAVVAQTSQGEKQVWKQAKTDSAGNFTINALPGKVQLVVQLGKRGSDWTAKAYDDLQVAEGGELDGLDFRLDPGVVVSGIVLTKVGGRPIKGARIDVRPQPGSDVWVQSDAFGRFKARVPAGKVYVAVDRIGDREMPNSAYLWATLDAAHNPPLELRIPDALAMGPVLHLGGRVVDAAGQPVGGATVVDLNTRFAVVSQDDGTFHFEGKIDAGDLLVATKGTAISGNAFEVLNGVDVKVKLDSTSSVIEGAVVGEDGKPVAGARITLSGDDQPSYYYYPEAVTDANGTYRFEGIYPGIDHFFLWAKKNGYGSVTIQPIKVSAGEDKKLETLTMVLADGVIDGQVLEVDGTPAKHAMVTAQSQESQPTETDDQGRFHLTNVPRGDHWIAAGRGNTVYATAKGHTGQTDVLIKLPKPPAEQPGVVLENRSGQVAPAIKPMDQVTGPGLDWTGLKGKIVVIDFWAVWCHPCVDALPQVQALYEKYRARGVELIGIHALGTPKDKVMAFVKSKGLTYPVTLDIPEGTGMGVNALAFGPDGIPHIFVISAQGRVAYDGHEVEEAKKILDGLLAGR